MYHVFHVLGPYKFFQLLDASGSCRSKWTIWKQNLDIELQVSQSFSCIFKISEENKVYWLTDIKWKICSGSSEGCLWSQFVRGWAFCFSSILDLLCQVRCLTRTTEWFYSSNKVVQIQPVGFQDILCNLSTSHISCLFMWSYSLCPQNAEALSF